jgi:hypothetical protein
MKTNLTYLQWVLFAALLAFHVKYGVIAGSNKMETDFPNYYLSAKMLAQHKNIDSLYTTNGLQLQLDSAGIAAKGSFNTFPPSTILVMLPLANMDIGTAKNIWMLVQILCLLGIVIVCSQFIQKPFLFTANIVMLAGFSLTNDFYLGQIYIPITLLLLVSILYLPNFKAGVMQGVVAAIKILPLVFLPVYFIQKNWKWLLGFAIGLMAITIVTICFTGFGFYKLYFAQSLLPWVQGRVVGQQAFAVQYQSFEVVFNKLFTFHAVYNPQPIIYSKAGYIICKSLLYITLAYIYINLFVKYYKQNNCLQVMLIYSILAVLLIEPGSATYHYLFLLPVFFMSYKMFGKAQQYKLVILFIVVNWAPILLQKLLVQIPHFWLFDFSRLACLCIFSIYVIKQLLNNAETKYGLPDAP